MAVNWDEFKPAGQTFSDAGSGGGADWSQFKPAAKPQPTAPAGAVPFAAKPKASGLIRRTLGDGTAKLAQGVIGLGETAVGIADLATGGHAGRALEGIGYRPEDTKEIIREYLSPEYREAEAEVGKAEGFIGTGVAMLENPSTIAGTVAESVPLMLGGGAVARGLGALPKLGAITRAAIGEGAVGAGASAEGLRQQSDDGLLTGRQAAAAVGTGVGTGLLGAAGGSVARRLGIADVDTSLAGGAAATAAVRPKLARRALAGAVSEGVLEEAPQSAQEQAWQNFANDKPLGEGVAEATAAGLLTGTAIGAPFGAISGGVRTPAKPAGKPQSAAEPGVEALVGPAPVYPDATPGSLSDAANATPAAQARQVQSPDDAGWREQFAQGAAPVLAADEAVPAMALSDDPPAIEQQRGQFNQQLLDARAQSNNSEMERVIQARAAFEASLKGEAAPPRANDAGGREQLAATTGKPADTAPAVASPDDELFLAATQDPTPAAATPDVTVAEPAAVAPAAQMSWLDAETGEFREPSNTEVESYIHDQFNQQTANGRGINTPVVKKALALAGVPARRREPLFRKVRADRRQGITSAAVASAEQVNPQRNIKRDGDELDQAMQPVTRESEDAVASQPEALAIDTPSATPVQAAAAAAATSPANDVPDATPAQREAGNFKVGRMKVAGMDVSIEYPAGVKRKPDHKELTRPYGYFRRTEGKDGDHVDVFLGDRANDPSLPVFVIDQVDQGGKYDEAKVVMGEPDEAAAREAYLSNYPDGWTGLGGITQMTQDEFKAWVNDPAKTKRRLSKPAPTRMLGGRKVKTGAAAPQAAEALESSAAPLSNPTAATFQSPDGIRPIPKTRLVGGRRVYATSARGTLEAYFQPGREVDSYGGRDRVMAFDWHDGQWQVDVRSIDADGNATGDTRRHQTLPNSRELRKVLGDPAQYGPKAKKATTVAARAASKSPAKKVAAKKEAPTPVTTDRAPPSDEDTSDAGELKTRIEDNGGRVLLASALTGKEDSRKLALSPESLAQVRERYSPIEGWWRETFGHGFEGLTESEARFILKLKGRPDPDTLRARIDAARVREVGGLGGRDDQDGQDPRPLSSRSDGSARRGLSLGRAQSLKTKLTAKWGDDAPPVVLVDSAEALQRAAGLPTSVLNDPDFYRAEGLYRGKATVWINVGAIPTEKRFAAVLAHEALGHYGVERIVGKEQWADITDAIERHAKNGTGSESVRRAIAHVRRTQPGVESNRLDFAKEVIAVMAEQGARNGLIGRVMAAVRRFLRQIMPSMQWSDADILALLSQAESFLHSGRAAPARAAMVRRHAFSKDGEGSVEGFEVGELAADAAFLTGLSPAERQSSAMVGLASAWWAEMGTDSPFFAEWYGQSKVVDSAGKPLKVYHGTGEDFGAFDGNQAGRSTNHLTAQLGIFFDVRKSKAEHYARVATNDVPAEMRVIEAYLSIQNPYVMSKAEFMSIEGADQAIALRQRLKREGFDGIQLSEVGQWVIFDPAQVKATDNRGTFDRADDQLLFSKANPAHLSAGQLSALQKIATFAKSEPWAIKAKRLTERWQEKLVQGVFDQFSPLKRLDDTAYMQARLSKGTDGALEATFRYGPPKLTQGALDVAADGKGLDGVLRELAGEHDLFFAWMAGNRAKALKAEGRERLFDDAEITELTKLNLGQLPDGRARTKVYAEALRAFNRYQHAVLNIAEQSGLIDVEHRKLWTSAFYVPFYRVMEGDRAVSPGQIGGLTGQKAFQRLKGGEEPLGDLLSNTLSNWSHLLSASMKNMAGTRALKAAEEMDIATAASADTKGTVAVMVEGKQRHYTVEDPLVLDALTMLHHQGWDNPAMKGMRWFKRALTVGVTVDPSFRIRNLMRDTISALASNEIGYNPLRNLVDGWNASRPGGDTYLRLIGGGGAIRFGTLLDGDQAGNAKRLIAAGVKQDQILDTQAKVQNAFTRAWNTWQELGDRAETVNRAVAYEQAIDTGKTHLEASMAARDLLDFSMGGKWAAVRFLTQIVPFMNARLQGMYKLGRAARTDPQRFGAVSGAVALASVLLHLMNSDDDEYRALPDWVRDTYWWVRLPGTDHALYIPKPFEIGALGSVAERATELMTAGDDYQARDFAQTLRGIAGHQLAMNPVPQAVKPFMEATFNRNTFQDRPIDSMGQERLPGADRYTARTSAGAIALGKALDYSPQRIEHMVRGYFGWLGLQALNVSDLAGRGIFDLPANPTRDLSKIQNIAVAGSFVRATAGAGDKYLSRYYDQQRQIDQIYAAYSAARQAGDFGRAQELAGDDRLRHRGLYRAAGVHMAKLNQRIRRITSDRRLSAAQKGELLDGLHEVRNRLAKRTTSAARARDQ